MSTMLNDDLLVGISPNATMDEDITSEAVEIRFTTSISIHLEWTGTPAGNFYIQGSNDLGETKTWVNVTSASAAGGAVGSAMLQDADAGYAFARLFYDFTSSTGTLTKAKINAKG